MASLLFLEVAVGVAATYQGVFGHERLSDVDAGLVGDGTTHPYHVGQFLGKIVKTGLVARFGSLAAETSGHHAGHLTGFFGENCHIGKRGEIACRSG